MDLGYFAKDNCLYNIKPEPTNIILTRYLYIKDEVEIALLASLLNKSDDAVFWAYELYHSGFQYRFFELIWQIYYEFYATSNPSLEAYLLKKYSCWEKEGKDDIYVSVFIQNLLIRPYNLDVFLIKNIVNIFEIETIYCSNSADVNADPDAQIKMCIDLRDFRSLAHWILTYVPVDYTSMYNFYEKVINILNMNNLTEELNNMLFTSNQVKSIASSNINYNKNKLLKEFANIMKHFPMNKTMLLAKVLSLFTLEKGRNLYVQIDKDDVLSYRTVKHIDGKAYTVLREEATYRIDTRFLQLFVSSRNSVEDPLTLLRYNWLYFASFSPIWFERIQKCCGYVNYQQKRVLFIYEDDFHNFYNKYNYEYDELGRCVIENMLPQIDGSEAVYNWVDFYNDYNKINNNSIIEVCEEELEELGKLFI